MLQRSLKTKLNKNKIKRLLWVVCCEDVTEHLKCQETPVFSNDTLTRSLISQFVSLDWGPKLLGRTSTFMYDSE